MLIYLISDISDEKFYNYDLEIWEEIKVYYNNENVKKSSFSLREKIHLFRSIDMKRFQISDFRIEFGTDNCIGHSAKSIEEFIASKTKETFSIYKHTSIDIYKAKRAEIMVFSTEFYPI